MSCNNNLCFSLRNLLNLELSVNFFHSIDTGPAEPLPASDDDKYFFELYPCLINHFMNNFKPFCLI